MMLDSLCFNSHHINDLSCNNLGHVMSMVRCNLRLYIPKCHPVLHIKTFKIILTGQTGTYIRTTDLHMRTIRVH